MNPTKCPGCGQEVEFVSNPEGQEACLHCGRRRSTTTAFTRINWLIFGVAYFAPTLLTILSVLAKSKDAPPVIALFGGAVSGIVCGTMLSRRLGRTIGPTILLAVVFSLVLGVSCIAMNCFGCLVSGFKLNF